MIAGLPAEVIAKVNQLYKTFDMSRDYKTYYGVPQFNPAPRKYLSELPRMTISDVIKVLSDLIDNHYQETP